MCVCPRAVSTLVSGSLSSCVGLCRVPVSPMSNLFDCVCDTMSLCSYIRLGACQSISALVLPVSLSMGLCPVGVFVYVPERLCPGLPVSLCVSLGLSVGGGG